MKILVINWQDITHPQSGGAEVHLFEIFGRIARQGHQVVLLCCRYEGARDRETIQDIQVHRTGSRNTFNLLVPRAYRALQAAYGFDVVVEDLNKIPFYGALYVKQPRLVLAHHFFGRTIYAETSCILGTYLYLAEWLIGPWYRGDRFVAVSQSTKQDLVDMGIPEGQIAVVYNAVDHATYRQRGLEKLAAPTVSFLGRLKRYKNVECFLKAAALVNQRRPEARFLVIGEGDHRPALMRLAEKLKLNDVLTFTGYVDQARKAELLERSHVVVNPSPKEGWGLTNIEANACGTPVIAADSPGLRDSVVDGETGLLFEYDRADELADKIVEVLDDDALRARLSAGALGWAARFDWDDSAAQMLGLLEEVAGQPGPRGALSMP